MTIQEAKDIIVIILAKEQGLIILELYDNFVRKYNGELKTENKKFEDILQELLSEGKIVESYSDIKEDKIYYWKHVLNISIPFFNENKSNDVTK